MFWIKSVQRGIVMIIELTTTSSNGFSERTKINAKSSNLTIYLYDENFETTSGRTLTQKYAQVFIPMCYQKGVKAAVELLKNSLEDLKIEKLKEKEFIINIAGNSISRFGSYDLWQPRLNAFMYVLLFNTKKVVESKGLRLSVRSGGQSGADWAGLIAANAIGLNGVGLFPAGFRQRDDTNKDCFSTREHVAFILSGETVRLLKEIEQRQMLLNERKASVYENSRCAKSAPQ